MLSLASAPVAVLELIAESAYEPILAPRRVLSPVPQSLVLPQESPFEPLSASVAARTASTSARKLFVQQRHLHTTYVSRARG